MPSNIWPRSKGYRSGDWEPGTPHIVTVAEQSFDFADVLSDANYNGFRFWGNIKNGYNGATTTELRANAATAAGDLIYLQSSYNSAVAGGRQVSNIGFGAIGVLNGLLWLYCEILPSKKDQQNRVAYIRGLREPENAINYISFLYPSGITTPALNVEIVSLGVGTNRADGIGVGSEFYLEKRRA
jgi:hypothetical protein